MGHVMHMGERRGIYWVLVGRPEGKRTLGRFRHRWEDLILRGMFRKWEVGGMDWIKLAQDRDRRKALVNEVLNLWVL